MRGRPSATPLLEVDALTVTYSLPSQRLLGFSRRFNAVDDVSIYIERGEAFGLVGETGCGKSSLSRAICGLAPISSGTVRLNGTDLSDPTGGDRREALRNVQMVFQDPGGSLNPRMRVGRIVAEPLEIHRMGDRSTRRDRVLETLKSVGLTERDAKRYPHEFSGGQRQRIAIARAVIVEPALVLADEPVSALDVSLQAQILNLISELRRKLGLALLFVSHDLRVVRHLCSRVAVMYLGRVVESGPTAEVLDAPRHPYTRELVASSPVPDPNRRVKLLASTAEPPNPAAPPPGCRYHPRCPHASEICRTTIPSHERIGGNRSAACHHAGRIAELEDIPT